MNNSEYWQKRMMILEESSHRDAEKCLRQVIMAFAHARIKINNEIEKWIARIAINNELSMAEAKRLLKGDELDEFHWTVEEYIEKGRDNGIDRKWEKQLENASSKVHISKWEALNLSIENYLREAFGKEDNLLEKLLEMTATERYTQTAYEIENGLGFGRAINTSAVEMIVKNPWSADERIFSDRIWTHMTEMKAELQDALLQQVLTGASPDEAIERMQKYVSDEVDNAKRRASTLVMTESAAIGNQAQMQCYEDLDVEEIEIVATLDSKTCSRCGSKDGLRYPLYEVKAGLNGPPFHANCRCCTAPYVEGFEPSQRMARNPETGKSEYIPNMTYEEWAEKYLKDSDKPSKLRRFVDVTSEKRSVANPGSGDVITDGSISSRDKETAEWLHSTIGGNIVCLPERPQDGKMPDSLWDGNYWEFKAPTTKNAIDDRIRKGVQQLDEALKREHRETARCGIVVDISNRKISLGDAVEEIENVAAKRCKENTEIIIRNGDELVKWIIKK